MSDDFSEALKGENDICGAKIEINGNEFTCQFPFHQGLHTAAVGPGDLEWDIDDSGRVVLNIPREAMERLTHPRCKRCGHRLGYHHPLCQVEGITDEALKQAMEILSQNEIPF